MEKKYRNALVIGKFQPLHKGHMALIEFATTQAGHTTICILAHEGEIIPLEQRKAWVDATYGCRSDITIYAMSYNPDELNESSESDVKSSHEWADYLRKCFGGAFGDFDVFIGSERYVQYMADYVGISHIIYDEARARLSISATGIKNDIIRYWDYLSPAAKQTYAKHICICGSESSGKSTACKHLEEAFSFVTMIPEIGRCLVGKSELCSEHTLKTIYRIHLELLKAVKEDPPTPIILWDTDNITTISYYTFLFPGSRPDFNEIPKADRYLFFESDIPFMDDGTRFGYEEAMRLRDHHIATYESFGIRLEKISTNLLTDLFDAKTTQVLSIIHEEIKNIEHFFKTR